ncbi:MAG: Phosphoglycerate mutase [Marmoricola sp.]|nr:Phosphoglycerate mutase [Marmoricola sp.]
MVMRHGRAEPYGDEDHRRLLTERGEREARAAGEWLAAQGLLPDHALVSSAARTRATWAQLAAASGSRVQPDFSDEAYAADADTATDLLRAVPPEAGTVLYLGHNPTAASLAVLLDSGDPEPDAFRVVGGGLPTGALAVLEVTVPWSELDTGTSRLVQAHVGL